MQTPGNPGPYRERRRDTDDSDDEGRTEEEDDEDVTESPFYTVCDGGITGKILYGPGFEVGLHKRGIHGISSISPEGLQTAGAVIRCPHEWEWSSWETQILLTAL